MAISDGIGYNTEAQKEGEVMGALREEEFYTVEDIYALPDGERAELIDGQIYFMAAPGRKHQLLLGALYREIANYIDSQEGECEVDIAPFAVFLNKDSKNYVEPDICVICDRSKLDDRGCNGAPDWIIEIVSQSSRSMDYYKKLFKYRTAGVREYWVVDNERQMATVYNFEQDNMEEYSFGKEIPVGIYDGFSMKIQSGCE